MKMKVGGGAAETTSKPKPSGGGFMAGLDELEDLS